MLLRDSYAQPNAPDPVLRDGGLDEAFDRVWRVACALAELTASSGASTGLVARFLRCDMLP